LNNALGTAWTRMTPAIAIAAARVRPGTWFHIRCDRNVARAARWGFYTRRNRAPFIKTFVYA